MSLPLLARGRDRVRLACSVIVIVIVIGNLLVPSPLSSAAAAPAIALVPAPGVVTTGAGSFVPLATFTDTNPVAAPSDRGYVERLYADVLHRSENPAFWTAQLTLGLSRRQVADVFVGGEEWPRTTVLRWWSAYLGRVPQPSDLTAVLGALAGAETIAGLRAALVASAENRGGLAGDDAYFDELFVEFLGRPVDGSARPFLHQLLRSGWGHEAIARFVATSEEARRYRAAQIVAEFLDRPALASDVDRYAPVLAAFDEDVATAAIVATEEYYRLGGSGYSATVSLDGGPATPALVRAGSDGVFVIEATLPALDPGEHAAIVSVSRVGESSTVTVTVPAGASRNERFLAGIGAEVLGRSLGIDELGGYLARIPAGGSVNRFRVAVEMVLSEEGRRQVMHDLYLQLLGRSPSAEELTYWVGRLGGSTVGAIRATLAASDEVWEAGGGIDTGWVELLFRRGLGRAAEPSAVGFWAGFLQVGFPRALVAHALLASTEGRRATADRYALRYLGRHATADELALGEIVVGIPVFELGYPSWLLASDSSYERFRPGGS